MRLRHVEGTRSSDVLVEVHHPDATVADLEEALAPDRPAGPLWVDGRRIRAATPLDRAGIVDGAVLSLDPPTDADATAVVVVRVTSGFDAGRCHALEPGRHLLGRTLDPTRHPPQAPEARVGIADPTVSLRHAMVDVAHDGSVVIHDLGSTNGTWIDGFAVTGPAPLAPGTEVRVGAARLVTDRPAPTPAPTAAGPVGGGPTRPRHRTPRLARPVALDPIVAPPPPEPAPAVTPIGAIGLVASVGVGLAMVVILRSWTYALFALLGPVVMVANALDARRRRRQARRRGGRRRRAALARLDRELTNRALLERTALAARLAGWPAAQAAVTGATPTCWDRRPHHPDAYEVRLGIGPAPWTPPVTGDPTAWAPDVAATVDRHRVLPDAVVGLRFEAGTPIAVVGPAAAARALVRSLVLQAAVAHGPADLQVAVLAGDDDAGEWDWLAWLPHGRDPAGGSLLASGRTAATAVAATLTAPPPDPQRSSRPRPLRVVVIDDHRGLAHRRHPVWTVLRASVDPATALVPVTVLGIGDPVPAMCTLVLSVHENGVVDVPASVARGPVAICAASLDVAADLARGLAAHDDPEVEDPGRGLPDRVPLLVLLGAERATVAGFVASWSAAGDDPPPRALLGRAADGPVVIDLVLDGPHALVAGTTGAGKSELLRSLVTALAAACSPDHLNFVLVDFKGGSAFDACARLPHTTGVVTDLDQHLAARALRCLEAELRHRERRLRDASASDLADLRRPGRGAAPLPRLVVVVDEFASLAAALPDFVEALVDVAQRGRSLGVHLVLATQRPAGSVSESIRANIGLRVALRVQGRDDSGDVIGAPDAADLPRDRPGRALVRLGPGELIAVQAALATCSTGRDRPPVTVQPLALTTVPRPPAPEPAPATPTDPTDLEVLVDAMAGAWEHLGGRPVRRPWPDPLPPDLAWPLPPHRDEGEPGSPGEPASLLIGLADDPDQQRHRPFAWRLQDGPLLAVGLPGSGTSTLAATIVLEATSRWTPEACHIHVIDLGAATLLPLAGLPHVGAVIGADQLERQRRLVAELTDELATRRAEMATVTTRRKVPPPERPRRLLVIDGLGGFRARWDDLDASGTWDSLLDLATGGAAVGIHVCCTAEGPAAAPHRLVSACRQRLVFRLGDPAEHGAFGIATRDVPPLPPGRAVAAEGPTVVQIARPVDGLAAAVARATAPVAALRDEAGPRWVGVLPDRVTRPEVTGTTTVREDGGLDLVIGLADRGLVPAVLTVAPGGHALVAGPPRSGRSTALASIAEAVATATTAAQTIRVVLVAGDRGATGACEVLHPDSADLADLVDHRGPLLVLVDDADLLGEHHRALVQLVTERRADRHVVAAGRNDRLRAGYSHWTRELRADGTGLLLVPDLDLDGELTGSRLPRHPSLRLVPGRAWLAGPGAGAEGFVQVALPTRPPLSSGDPFM